ncbi:hypothetical protein [Flavobacterium pedocola]
MKKLIYLIALIGLTGCNSDSYENQSAVKNAEKQNATLKGGGTKPTCLFDFTVTASQHPTIANTSVITWDISNAVYSSNTSSSIEIQPLDYCGLDGQGSGTSLSVITFPVNIFTTTSLNINHVPFQRKCYMWRFINQGRMENGQSCYTATDWEYFSLYY